MKTIKRTAAVLLAGVACMLLSAAAGASPIDVTSFSMKYSGAPTGTVSYPNAITRTVYAGEIRLNTSDGPVDAFCIDVTNLLRTGTFDTRSTNEFDRRWDARFQLAGKLYDHYYHQATDGLTSAAFQLALWAIVNDSATSQSTLFGGAQTLANTWLGTLNSLGSLGNYRLTVLEPFSPIANQRLLTAVNVPEPGSLFLLGLGVLGAGVTRRFRKH
jgi:hypothetical protein